MGETGVSGSIYKFPTNTPVPYAQGVDEKRTSCYLQVLDNVSSSLDYLLVDLKEKNDFYHTPNSPILIGEEVEINTSDILASQKTKAQMFGYDSVPSSAPVKSLNSAIASPYSALPTPLSVSQALVQGPISPLLLSSPLQEITLRERILLCKAVWFLPNIYRQAAVHYLQASPVGTFIVRSSRQTPGLSLSMKHPDLGKGTFIENYAIENIQNGYKLQKETKVYPLLEDLILDHCENKLSLPCHLQLPRTLQTSKNKGELRSLAILEEEFWKSHHSRTHLKREPSKSDMTSLNAPSKDSSYYKAPTSTQNSQSSYVFSTPSPTTKDALIDFQGNHDNILQLYENVSSGWKRHSIGSHTGLSRTLSSGSDQSQRNSATFVFQHKRSSSDCTRQLMRYSSPNDMEQFSLASKRYPPPTCAPPPPPVEGCLSSTNFGTIYHQANTGSNNSAFPPVSPYSNSRTISRVGSSHSQSVSDENFMRFDQNLRFSFTAGINSKESNVPVPVTQASAWNISLNNQTGSNWQSSVLRRKSKMRQDKLLSRKTTSFDLSEFDPLSDKFRDSFSSKTTLTDTRSLNIISKSENDILRVSVADVNSFKAPVTSMTSTSSSSSRSSYEESHPSPKKKEPAIYRGSYDHLTSLQETETPLSEMEKSQSLPSTLKRGMSLPKEEGFLVIEAEHLLENQLGVKGSAEESTAGEVVKEKLKEEGAQKYSENRNMNRSVENLQEEEGLSSLEGKKNSHRFSSKLKRITKRRTRHQKKRKPLHLSDPASAIRDVLTRLSKDPNEKFCILLEKFQETQRDLCEVDKPDGILMKIRQFMNGLKNYLFNGMEKEVDFVIDKFSELENNSALDAIFEGALHQLVLEPLLEDIYMCFIRHFNSTGAIALLDSNIRAAKENTPAELGIRDTYLPPSPKDMAEINRLFVQMRNEASPLKKLEVLLDIVKAIYKTVEDTKEGRETITSMGADDFLPMLIYVVVQCDQFYIEIEVEYMWGLLDPSMLSGEGGYYLTTLSSAICVLKQFEKESELETKGFVTIFVACGEEYKDIKIKSVPVLPRMTSVDVCNIVVNKLNLDTKRPHQLFILHGGKEVPLKHHNSIFKEKTEFESKHSGGCRFGLRPEDMEIQWPAITFTEFGDI